MKVPAGDTRFLMPGVLLLFLGLAVLAVFLLVGESRRARILVEYEADRTASTLADSFRSTGALDENAVDARVRAFALYRPSGEASVRLGDAPAILPPDQARSGFTYEQGQRLLTLVRVFGMGGPGMRGMMGGGRGMMGGGGPSPGPLPGMMGGEGPIPGRGPFHGNAGALFLSMDISGYYRSRFLFQTAAIISPMALAGLAALFLSLLASNARHRRRAEEQENLARLGESARTLAHEIRNPLGAIRIKTGLLRKKIPATESAHLDAIDEEVERLSLLTRRVSDFIRNPKGTPEPVLLEGFLRELSEKMPGPVSFTAAGDQSGCTVTFDRELLRSVVENLIRNALESYSDGSPGQGVEMELSRDKDHVLVCVRDRGKGIPPELSQRVFDPFFTDKVQGSGVGLALSRRFVEAAGGTLQLLPRHGGGTEARITLPAEGKT